MIFQDWSRSEVEAIVDDYLSMLASELTGTPFNKAAHNRALQLRLRGRSRQSIEFKHANVSAALLDAGFPYISGYKPRANYQSLLAEVLFDRMAHATDLHEIAAADADRPIVVPEIDDILSILRGRPAPATAPSRAGEPRPAPPRLRSTTNYIEREARNQSLGSAGELFAIRYETARLIHAGKESLAGKIEHTSRVRGDSEGYDVLSFEECGKERLIEVKTTKYGLSTPFFVSRNEVAVSARHAESYHVYRLFEFNRRPGMFVLPGAIDASCSLAATTFLACPR